ncbi:hypothetical protein TGME49_220025 [Toxoplasma gondii ME49]|uniref:Uncharacterized protein n=2 Tax=Toxoplasma gondii TaxID=5811 RepID=A0A086KLY9_TOXGO|nr:hypothetical protein TGME49_220025 [Toxoplasma gondii ME49]EPT27105.1 hypothetical protein TGME49_220025 [Toxoplasma gondii ME49]KFG45407.1 hypothetical protein TGDOM2_220025 [Toxoplasma gondii GAB2-2007-GAL-DOM2]|eukprot:XP_018636019.1 hypothetical protein TGME49_220025 [Toxoplasma gondii ME49]
MLSSTAILLNICSRLLATFDKTLPAAVDEESEGCLDRLWARILSTVFRLAQLVENDLRVNTDGYKRAKELLALLCSILTNTVDLQRRNASAMVTASEGYSAERQWICLLLAVWVRVATVFWSAEDICAEAPWPSLVKCAAEIISRLAVFEGVRERGRESCKQAAELLCREKANFRRTLVLCSLIPRIIASNNGNWQTKKETSYLEQLTCVLSFIINPIIGEQGDAAPLLTKLEVHDGVQSLILRLVKPDQKSLVQPFSDLATCCAAALVFVHYVQGVVSSSDRAFIDPTAWKDRNTTLDTDGAASLQRSSEILPWEATLLRLLSCPEDKNRRIHSRFQFCAAARLVSDPSSCFTILRQQLLRSTEHFTYDEWRFWHDDERQGHFEKVITLLLGSEESQTTGEQDFQLLTSFAELLLLFDLQTHQTKHSSTLSQIISRNKALVTVLVSRDSAIATGTAAWLLCHISNRPDADPPLVRSSLILRLLDSLFDTSQRTTNTVPSVCSFPFAVDYLTTILKRRSAFDEADTIELAYRTIKIAKLACESILPTPAGQEHPKMLRSVTCLSVNLICYCRKQGHSNCLNILRTATSLHRLLQIIICPPASPFDAETVALALFCVSFLVLPVGSSEKSSRMWSFIEPPQPLRRFVLDPNSYDKDDNRPSLNSSFWATLVNHTDNHVRAAAASVLSGYFLTEAKPDAQADDILAVIMSAVDGVFQDLDDTETVDLLITLLNAVFLSNACDILARTCFLHSVFSLAIMFDVAVLPIPFAGTGTDDSHACRTVAHAPRVLFCCILLEALPCWFDPRLLLDIEVVKNLLRELRAAPPNSPARACLLRLINKLEYLDNAWELSEEEKSVTGSIVTRAKEAMSVLVPDRHFEKTTAGVDELSDLSNLVRDIVLSNLVPTELKSL